MEQLGDLVKLLMEDRQKREEQIAIEKEQIIQDRQRREEQIAFEKEQILEERQKREEQMALEKELMNEQMEVLKMLVEGTQRREDMPLQEEPQRPREKDATLTRLTDQDDIEAYLTTFERIMVMYQIPGERWAVKLAPHLTGKAQQAYAAMRPEEAGKYKDVKQAILSRYDISEDTYQQRFRSARRKEHETYRELAVRMLDWMRKWSDGCNSVEELRELIVVEQLLDTLPVDIRIWVHERKPKTSAQAGKLADDYMQARRCSKEMLSSKGERQAVGIRRCHQCGQTGHIARDCRNKFRSQKEQQQKMEGLRCFNCKQRGHIAKNCPHQVMYCKENKTPSHVQYMKREECGILQPGIVEGREVADILLDTGCSRTLVRRDLVNEEKMLEGEEVKIRCAHGDTVLYPLAEVEMKIHGETIQVKAAVSDNLPMGALLGTDVPELNDLLEKRLQKNRGENGSKNEEEALVMVTRAKFRDQQLEAEVQEQKEMQSGVMPKSMDYLEEPVDDDREDTRGESNEWTLGEDFAEDLFNVSKEKRRLTKKEKRLQCLEYAQKKSLEEFTDLDVTAADLKKMQEDDTTLEEIRKAADGEASSAGMVFFQRDGLLYRQWTPPNRRDEMVIEQLVIPVKYRKTILDLAHQIPMAGHMGKDKTARRILQRFYWPTVFKDVAEYYRSCETCQKSSRKKPRHAPLVPLPIIGVPFQRIAMDIIGPLPQSRSGNRYVLVICDYATRYPEAIPLRSIDAENVAEELIQLFARVGVPEEILTDQGSNFTSQLLKEYIDY